MTSSFKLYTPLPLTDSGDMVGEYTFPISCGEVTKEGEDGKRDKDEDGNGDERNGAEGDDVVNSDADSVCLRSLCGGDFEFSVFSCAPDGDVVAEEGKDIDDGAANGDADGGDVDDMWSIEGAEGGDTERWSGDGADGGDAVGEDGAPSTITTGW